MSETNIKSNPIDLSLEVFLNEKFKPLMIIVKSMSLEVQQNLFKKMISSLKEQLINFHQNLQNTIYSLTKNQNELSNHFKELSETLEDVKKIFQEKRMKFMKKLVEEENNRDEVLKTNPNLVNFIHYFSKNTECDKSQKINQYENETKTKQNKVIDENKRTVKFKSFLTFPAPSSITQKLEDYVTYENDDLDTEDEQRDFKQTDDSNTTQENHCHDHHESLKEEGISNLEKPKKKIFLGSEEIFFQKYVKNFSSLEEILRNFCPTVENLDKSYMVFNHLGKITQKYYDKKSEEEISMIRKENDEKFQKVLSYVELHHKFPDFAEQPELFGKCSLFRFFPRAKYLFRQNFFYEKNLNFIESLKATSKNHNRKIIHDILINHLEYQKEFLILPYRADYFNKFSSRVFDYLQNIGQN